MRLADWKARLTEYLGQSARAPYSIGTHDCALFAAGAVQAVTGTDLAADWRGRYTTKAEGLRQLQRAGHDDHIALAAAYLPEITPVMAAAGDVAVIRDPESGAVALGVVQGEMVYVLRPSGLGLLARAAMLRAFRT
jgi:hypothetical protein